MKDFTAEIDDIMERFDWERVQRTMKALNWTWARSHPDVPTIDQLKSTARECLEQVVRTYKESPGWNFVATGGFYARIYDFKAGNTELNLAFEVETVRGIA
jgi:hypothetical protein